MFIEKNEDKLVCKYKQFYIYKGAMSYSVLEKQIVKEGEYKGKEAIVDETYHCLDSIRYALEEIRERMVVKKNVNLSGIDEAIQNIKEIDEKFLKDLKKILSDNNLEIK